ncbi:MAG: hypothetical protein LBS39_01570 [Campylobacteraceae bacterium]|jgi:hypothetical protein|nr:hypothetical protein [Campylobacteraceae bacterium]
MLKKVFMVTIAAFLMAGCNSDGGNSSQEVKKPSDEIPVLDRTDTIAGIDEDGNGIRDDIEEYINKNYSNEGHRKAMLQYAKTLQANLLVDTTDQFAVKWADIQNARAQHCIFLKFDITKGDENPSTAWNKVRSMTTNTKVRLRAYLDFDKALWGIVLSLPEGDTCE